MTMSDQAIIDLEISYEEEKEICEDNRENLGHKAAEHDDNGTYNLRNRAMRKKPSGAAIRKNKARDKEEGESGKVGGKRQLVSPDSFVQDSRVKRHKDDNKKFSDVLKGNEVIVKFVNYPEVLLDEKSVSALEKHLLKKIDTLKIGEMAPQFHQRKLIDGYWRIKCIGQQSKDWLCKIVDVVRLKGHLLHVINADELPSRPKCRVFIPGECHVDSVIMHRFKVQNSDFDFSSWRIVSNKRHFKFDGRNVMMELATESVDLLKAKNWYMAYGLTQVRFHLLEDLNGMSGGIVAKTDGMCSENKEQTEMDFEELVEVEETSEC
jgi:hypothetical protein